MLQILKVLGSYLYNPQMSVGMTRPDTGHTVVPSLQVYTGTGPHTGHMSRSGRHPEHRTDMGWHRSNRTRSARIPAGDRILHLLCPT